MDLLQLVDDAVIVYTEVPPSFDGSSVLEHCRHGGFIRANAKLGHYALAQSAYFFQCLLRGCKVSGAIGHNSRSQSCLRCPEVMGDARTEGIIWDDRNDDPCGLERTLAALRGICQ